jgi:hypothetical protein
MKANQQAEDGERHQQECQPYNRQHEPHGGEQPLEKSVGQHKGKKTEDERHDGRLGPERTMGKWKLLSGVA